MNVIFVFRLYDLLLVFDIGLGQSGGRFLERAHLKIFSALNLETRRVGTFFAKRFINSNSVLVSLGLDQLVVEPLFDIVWKS